MKASFEEAILEQPDDLQRYLVYADWLQRRGEPRGELMAVQVRLEDTELDPRERHVLRKREQQLLGEHRQHLLGDLVAVVDAEPEYPWLGKPELHFERGFVHNFRIPQLSDAAVDGLKSLEHLRFLRELVVLAEHHEEDGVIQRLGELDLSGVRRLILGDPEDQCHLSCRTVEMVRKAAGSLVELGIYAHQVPVRELFALEMPRLRSLTVHHLNDYPVEGLAANASLGGLRTLSFFPHALELDDDPYLDLDSVRVLTASTSTLTGLEHLMLRLCTAGDEGMALLAAWPGLKRLRSLDLMYGEVSDKGAELLAEAGIGHLERLDLTGNSLTPAGVARLKATGAGVIAADQSPWGDDREYLWYGDME